MQDSSGLRYFTWDQNGMNLLCERDSAGAVTAYYTHGFAAVDGIGSPVAVKQNRFGAAYFQYPGYDHKGNLTVVTDENGNEVARYNYTASGVTLTSEVTGGISETRLGYQANWIRLQDSPCDLYASPTRLEVPKYGMFLGRDPKNGLAGDTKYADGDPVSKVDPDGMLECTCKGQCKELPAVNSQLNRHIQRELDFNFARTSEAYAPISDKVSREKEIRAELWGVTPGTAKHRKLRKELYDLRMSMRAVRVRNRDKQKRELYRRLGDEASSKVIASKTKIEAWLYGENAGLPAKYRRKSSLPKQFSTGYAPCIYVTCPHGKYCIGTDKIGHFFQQGGMLAEIRELLGESYAKAFGEWSEGLYTPPETGASAEARKIYKWLTTGMFTFRWAIPHKRVAVSKYRNRWGGFAYYLMVPGAEGSALPVYSIGAARSKADMAANMAGMRFWRKFEREIWDNTWWRFDICKWVDKTWVE